MTATLARSATALCPFSRVPSAGYGDSAQRGLLRDVASVVTATDTQPRHRGVRRFSRSPDVAAEAGDREHPTACRPQHTGGVPDGPGLEHRRTSRLRRLVEPVD